MKHIGWQKYAGVSTCIEESVFQSPISRFQEPLTTKKVNLFSPDVSKAGFVPRFTLHSSVNVMLWHDTEVVKVCSKTAHACCHIRISWSFNVLINVGWSLTPCHQSMQKCVIVIPCVVDESRISAFSYTTSCTCICQLVWLTFCFKVIDSFMQDAWASSYK